MMYELYQGSEVCYVFMHDVQVWKYDQPLFARKLTTSVFEAKLAEVEKSEWWTRGWTLQELIAPRNVKFFGSKPAEWQYIGDKISFRDLIHRRTGIDRDVLRGASLEDYSIAQRMSWAAERETTLVEDQAYCLLGIFGVSMPLLYGEGKRAFIRLQEEIMKHSDDQTLFAWKLGPKDSPAEFCGPLATSPSQFRGCEDLVPVPDSGLPVPYGMTNKGLRIELPIVRVQNEHRFMAMLQCSTRDTFPANIALPLVQVNFDEPHHFARDGRHTSPLEAAELYQLAAASTRTIFMRPNPRQKLNPGPALLIDINHSLVSNSRITFADSVRSQLSSRAECPTWNAYYALPGCRQGAVILLAGTIGIPVLFSVETLRCKTIHMAQQEDGDGSLRDLESDLGPMHFAKISKLVSNLSDDSEKLARGAGGVPIQSQSLYEQLRGLEHRFMDEGASETSVAQLLDGRVVRASIAAQLVQGQNVKVLELALNGVT